MDANKICFILCVNHELYTQEAIYYINNLTIPDGFTVDILTVLEASGMAAGYNEAMAQTDAKYKVYLHQDVFIIEPDFIKHLVHLFQDPNIGMIGMVGSPKFPDHGIMWYGERIGRIYSCNIDHVIDARFDPVSDPAKPYQEVEAIDGLLIATQYDVKWREDVFKKWDFYDVSQSFEFRKKGYQLVIPKMEKPWCIHDNGMLSLTNYYNERLTFLKEYGFENTALPPGAAVNNNTR